jgi:hypothetical protein
VVAAAGRHARLWTTAKTIRTAKPIPGHPPPHHQPSHECRMMMLSRVETSPPSVRAAIATSPKDRLAMAAAVEEETLQKEAEELHLR